MQLDNKLFGYICENYDRIGVHKYMQLTEVEKVNTARTLMDRIYVNIAESYNTINFETIPESAGDITKMKEYANLISSIDLLKDIEKNSKQEIPEIYVISKALENIIKFKEVFHMGFVQKNASVILLYNILTLALYCGVSLMISVLVDYINMENNDSVQVIINKKYNKKSSYLMIDALIKFNTSVKDGSFHKMIEASYRKSEPMTESVIFTAISVATAIVAIFAIIPLVKELIYLFYYSRMKLSDAAEIQANLINSNIENLQTTGSGTTKMIKIQKFFADKLITLSHIFAFKYEKNEKQAKVESKAKLTSNDVVLF